MKKKLCLILTLLVLGSGGLYSQLDNLRSEQQNISNDNKLQSMEKIALNGKIVINADRMLKVDGCFTKGLDINDFEPDATEVVNGTIKKVEFLPYDGVPWSKLTVKVDKSYKGSLNTENTIIIYELGGYLSYSDFHKNYGNENDSVMINYTDAVVEMDYFQESLHKAGDRAIFYIMPSKSDLPFDSNSYELVCSSYSELRYNSSTKDYIKLYDEGKQKNYTENQAINEIDTSSLNTKN